jgi:photosystem II stability/assembly factor-like uncharacterized protein
VAAGPATRWGTSGLEGVSGETARAGEKMSKGFTILIGTIGNGLWRSDDAGESFRWVTGIASVDLVVRGFGVDPHDSRHVVAGTGILHTTPETPLVGTRHGLHESFDGGASWSPIERFREIECWRISFDPSRKGRYYVGTRPAKIYRTEDGGSSFEKLSLDVDETCFGIGLPRVTNIAVHPKDTDMLLVSIEIGGVYRSLDGGDTWEQVMTDIETPVPHGNVFGPEGRIDCHFSGFSLGDPELMLVATPDGAYRSEDSGKSWADFPTKSVFATQYHRDFIVKLDDPSTIFWAIGEDTGGQEGAVLVTHDRGATWETADLPVELNSPAWAFAQHSSDPDTILVASHNGQLFITRDAGSTWTKTRREFTEIRGMCWLPS